MKRAFSFHLALSCALVLGSGGTALGRGPIAILSDADFTAENGVVSGTGSAEDPYVLAGLEVNGSAGDLYGIRIDNVSASFVLRGVILQGFTDPFGAAVRVAYAAGGRIEGVTVSASLNGIELVASQDMTLRSLVLYTSGIGLRVVGDTVEHYRHDIDASNELNGKAIQYLYGLEGATVSDLNTTHLTIAGSRNLTIQNNTVVNGDGLRLAFVTDSTVTANAVYRTTPVYAEHGLFLLHSSDNVIEQNTFKNNRLAGLQLTLSPRNAVRNNQVLANDSGVRIVASDDNVITNNVLFANVSGILLSGGTGGNTVSENVIYHENTKQGITLEMADGNRIERNGLTDCEIGITLGEQATGNVVEANTILGGAYGISVYGSYNWIHRNLIAQAQRGILFVETFGRSTARGNDLRGNVFTDSSQQHLYLNLDSANNRLSDNAFLGAGARLVADYGTANLWSSDGVGNFWGTTIVEDKDANGIGDAPVRIVPAMAEDPAPRASWSPVGAGLGVLGTLGSGSVTLTMSGGGVMQLEVLVADSGMERWAGFRGFPGAYIERFPGILFVFDSEAKLSFTMQTVLFDLDIAFFASDGTFVGATTMTANSEEAYTAPAAFLYALELPAGSLARWGVGEGAKLVLP